MLTFVALSGCAEVTGRVPWQLPAAAGAFPMERFAYGWVCCRCQIPPAVSEGGRRGLAVGRDHILATLGRELQITVVNYGDVFSQLELISWLWRGSRRYLHNILRDRGVTCAVCATPVSGHDVCLTCERAYHTAGLAEIVVPLSGAASVPCW